MSSRRADDELSPRGESPVEQKVKLERPDDETRDNEESRTSEGVFCEICGNVSATEEEHDEHFFSHSGYPCNRCIKIFNSRKELMNHLGSVHFQRKVLKKGKRRVKRKSQGSGGPSLSSNASERRPVRQLAERSSSAVGSLTCFVCKKKFKHKSLLTRHMRCHTGERPFSCDTCGKGFTQRAHLTTHSRIHSGEKPFKCVVCGTSFSRNGSLKNHFRIHTGERAHKCNICGKRFTVSGSLTEHIRTHTGERPFSCEICGKGFTTGGNLTNHSRVHSGEKPFRCVACGTSFSQNSNLKTHFRTHTGDHPHKCNICGKRFTRSNGLAIHMRTHAG